jgi:hypothetical protein
MIALAVVLLMLTIGFCAGFYVGRFVPLRPYWDAIKKPFQKRTPATIYTPHWDERFDELHLHEVKRVTEMER